MFDGAKHAGSGWKTVVIGADPMIGDVWRGAPERFQCTGIWGGGDDDAPAVSQMEVYAGLRHARTGGIYIAHGGGDG